MLIDNQQLLLEKEEKIKEIESDVLLLNEVFKDLAIIVKDQDENINIISDNMEYTVEYTEEATTELKIAYKKKKNTCVYCLFGSLLGAVVGGPIGFAIHGKLLAVVSAVTCSAVCGAFLSEC